MDLFNLVTPNTTLLTPNRRLAATLSHQFDQSKIIQDKTCWQTLDILPLPSWLQRLWQELSAKNISAIPLLLTENQKAILWEVILRKSPASEALLQISETAKLAESAYELLQLWEINLNDPALSSTEDSQVFQEWARQFQKSCKKNNWIDSSHLADILTENLISGKIILPNKIILVGFTEISPQHLSLLNTCEKAGCEIIYYHAKKSAKSIKKIALFDGDTELRAMACWAKSIYESTPEKRPYLIGCVVPQLEKLREPALNIFSDIFSQDKTFTLDHTLLPFNISAGKNLFSFPIIRTAIELLKLAENKISLQTMIHLLRSPFVGDAEQEKLKRSYFENHLKNKNIKSISIERLAKSDSSYRFSERCPAFAKRIQAYLNHFSTLKKTLPMNEWAKNFIELLKYLGWPGERFLNSHEYQITQRWLDLLVEYSNLDNILEPQTFSQAIEWLIQLSIKTVFQAQSPEAPIQILGVLEAAELPFEYLWVMGLDDSLWPPPPRPNPLLPQRMQKTLNMPHATVERELAYCESLLKQLKQSATHVIFSYPEINGDIHLRPSSLLNTIEPISLSELSLNNFSSPAQTIFANRQLEYFIDEIAPPIGENEIIRGGTHIFKQQAACPFKAFAELRLHARFIETPTSGLRAIDRGIIVHKALELIWKNINDSTTLTSMPENTLKEIVHRCSEDAINLSIESFENNKSNKRYMALELQRLEKIILEWLALECQRPEFKVVLQEHEINTIISNIPVTMRVDRVDELNDGSQLIIDYKTGKHNELKKWFSARPEEPQLPLYCIASGDNISGIAFGQLHPDNVILSGVAKKNINIKSIKTLPEIPYSATLWNEQLHEWKIVLENLGKNFMNGIAHIDPKDINTTCNHCKLQSFCRVHEK